MRAAWRGLLLLVLMATAAAGCGPAPSPCDEACSKVGVCGIVSTGLACGPSCTGPDLTCAQCIQQYSCNAITGVCGGNGVAPCAGATWVPGPRDTGGGGPPY